MTPEQLLDKLKSIIAKTCKCEVAWTQHKGPITEYEAIVIRAQVGLLLTVIISQEADRELERQHIQNLGEDVQG